MRVSHNTVAVLRNFARINNGIRFERGHTLRTISSRKTIYAEAVLDEECPKEVCLYSLKDLLGLIARSHKPLQLTFDTTASDTFPNGCVTLQEVGSKKMIGSESLCPSECIDVPPDKPSWIDEEVAFDLTAADLIYLKMHNHQNTRRNTITITWNEDIVQLQKRIHDDSTLGMIEIPSKVSGTAPFRTAIKVEHLKCLMPGSYSVCIFKEKIAHFLFKGFPLKYWMLLEK